MSKETIFELPMGYVDADGTHHKECVIRKMVGRDEELISDRKLSKNPAIAITELLAEVTMRIGTINKPGKNIIRNLSTGDRDKILLELRKFSLGEILPTEMKCPRFDETFEVDINLNDMEEQVWDPNNNIFHTGKIGEIEYELIDGVDIIDKETKETITCKRGVLRLPDGKVEEQIAGQALTNPAKANTILLAMAMKELEGHAMVGQNVTRDMTRRDREYLTNHIGKNKVGPSLKVDTVCPICGDTHTFRMEFQHFFSNGTRG